MRNYIYVFYYLYYFMYCTYCGISIPLITYECSQTRWEIYFIERTFYWYFCSVYFLTLICVYYITFKLLRIYSYDVRMGKKWVLIVICPESLLGVIQAHCFNSRQEWICLLASNKYINFFSISIKSSLIN